MQTRLVIKHISNWLKDYANSSNNQGFVIGISGGIDSAVTSTLAAKSNLSLICVEMPIHQNRNQAKRAVEHINWLKKNFSNISSKKINLSSVFDEFVATMPPCKKNKLALANTRARLRMTTLYYLAQTNNSLVLGTGNKVEDFGIGFFTKYGDGGVDLSPIADLLKSEVYTLGKALAINNDILTAEPTDGLWEEEKTDAEQIGATYPELEWAMQFNGNENILSKREREILKIYKDFNANNRHKMKNIPVCKIPQIMR